MFNRKINAQIKELYKMAAATQAQIDALTARVNSDDTQIKAIAALVLTAIQTGSPSVDVTALTTALTGEEADITTLQGELPTSPAPAAASTKEVS